MSLAHDPSLNNLNDCGCCEGLGARTPVVISNRPGLSAIAYRIGTHPQFKASMLAGLSDSAAERLPLRHLNTRDDDDFSIALLDAWATVADVLTFYQERIANESYLRTAIERLSLVELTRALGYELGPGVAASTYLAFTVEDAPGAPGHATIDPRTMVQSLPGPGETPQTFETTELLEAQAAWNAIKPRQTTPQTLTTNLSSLRLQGTDLNLRPGDAILIGTYDNKWAVGRVTSVRVDTPSETTTITLGLVVVDPVGPPASVASVTGVWVLRLKAAPFGHNAPKEAKFDGQKASYDEWLLAPADLNSDSSKIDLDSVYDLLQKGSWSVIEGPLALGGGRVVRRVDDVQTPFRSDYGIASRVTQVKLDKDWRVALPNAPSPGQANARVLSLLRSVVVYTQSEPLLLAEAPLTDPVSGREFDLDNLIEGLEAGRKLLFSGKRAKVSMTSDLFLGSPSKAGAAKPMVDEPLVILAAPPAPAAANQAGWHLVDRNGVQWEATPPTAGLWFIAPEKTDPVVSEPATLEELSRVDPMHGRLKLTEPLQHVYDRTTLEISANVALATHGETREETLGSGDAGQAFQRFTLRQSPLTYVPAETPTGTTSTLELRVNELLWEEVKTLRGHGLRDRIYVTRRDDEGKTTVQFGDGRSGARLPGGHENVRAIYRQGIGRVGQVKAGQLSLLMTRPLGVRGVNNPLPATGAGDPERTEDARRNAPPTVLTLDRIVSLEDFADFARGFPGIARALATWTWSGNTRGVLVTVSGEEGDEVPIGSRLHTTLVGEMGKAGDPRVPVQVKPYTHVLFKIAASVQVDYPTYIREKVIGKIRSALQDRFSFHARDFGQSVALSEVVATIQAVAGVVAVDLELLYTGDTPGRSTLLTAAVPTPGERAEAAQPAELLTLDPASLTAVVAES